MSRAPKLGEVWTTPDGTPYTCIDEIPDDSGDYGWSFPYADQTLKEYDGLQHLTPPKAEPPVTLSNHPWVAVEVKWLGAGHFAACDFHRTPAAAFAEAPGALGAINVLTGEWVPRD